MLSLTWMVCCLLPQGEELIGGFRSTILAVVWRFSQGSV